MVLFFGSCGVCTPHAQDDETSQHSQEAALPIYDVVTHPPSQEHRDPAPVDESIDSTPAPKPAEDVVRPLVLEQAISAESSTPDSVEARSSLAAGGSTSGTSPRRNWNTRLSIADPETSSVPRQYRHLVTLAALLPQRVIETLVVQRRLGKPSKPRFATEGLKAALLFIDISGFTASMEMFAQQGSQGIEKFWKMFNAYFCDLLDVIEGTGGDIDCFAGDAILIVYEAERLWDRTGELVRNRIQTPDGTLPTKLCLATMAASQCGGRLLNKLSPYHFSDGATESSLTLHGSIGAGSLRTVNIGGTAVQGESSFATFVCGGVFQQLAVAHDLSGKSEFCLSGEAVALTGHWLDLWDHPEHETCKVLKGIEVDDSTQQPGPLEPTAGESSMTPNGNGEPGLRPAKARMPSLFQVVSEQTTLFERLNLAAPEYEGLAEDLKSFISSSVLDKMESVRGGGTSESGGTLGELRRGTVGFVKFDIKDINSTACVDPEKGIREVAQVAMMGFREVLIAGGYVNKIIMDEKGLVLLYAFGTPGCSYEYNNLHAIRVALRILKSSKDRFKRKTGVGISTGNICTGIIGKLNFRSEYALAGDVVNLAARLAAASEKEGQGVLCDETTMESLTGATSVHKEAMAGIKVDSVGSMRPKGKSYDINVFQLSNICGKRQQSKQLRRSGTKRDVELMEARQETLRKFVPVESRASPLEQMRTYVRRCNAGEVHCVFLESDAGLGKSTLVSALSENPGIQRKNVTIMKTPTGAVFDIEGRDAHVVKIQGAHLEQSTPYHVLSELTAALMAIIVEPDRKGRIVMEEFSEAMPTEVQRYLELLKYLNVPMTRGERRKDKDKDTDLSRKFSRKTQRRNSSSAALSVSTFQSTRSETVSLSSKAGSGSKSGSRSTGYHFQRFQNEGQDEDSQFESVNLLSLEAAEALCSRMKDGIPVEDRDYGSAIFKQCFVGSQAVDWMSDMGISGSREEAVAIGQRLVEFGLIDHVNSVFRFKDDVLFFEFRSRTTVWPRATQMDVDAAKALALRINMELELTTIQDEDGEVHKACFSGEMLVEWMVNEYLATCVNEAVAIADKLMSLSIIESTNDTDEERFKPSNSSFYVLRALALSALPPTHIFGLLKQLCLSILQVACVCAAEIKQLVLVVIEDLQWVDSGTLDMILAFLEAGKAEPWEGGCMFLLSTRPASTFPRHLSTTRDKIVNQRSIVTVIELGALSDQEAERLTCRFLEVDELDFGLRKLVMTSCSGSPLFIWELCQSLCATQGIQKVITSAEKSRAALKTTDKASSRPTSVQEIVAARIDTLESTVSLVLKVAAVIGETFSLDVLRAIFPVDLEEEALKGYLNTLVFKDFLTEEDSSGRSQCFKFTHSMMSVAAYGMLLHSYRWKLHFRVATVMTEEGNHSNMVLARHWLQVAMGSPSAAEVSELGGDEAYRELLHKTIEIVSRAIGELMAMGQFIDASLHFNEGLEVLKRMADTPKRKCLEIDLLLQGCQLTQYTEGYTLTLLEFARKAHALACEETEGVDPRSRLRAGLFVEQYEVMYGDAYVAIERLEVLLESIPAKEVVLRIEPAAILAAVLTQRGQFKKARRCLKVVEEWKAAGSPVPACLVMYEPIVTLLSMNIVLAAMAADDSRHLRWLNELERYLKSTDSGVSKKPFNLYASMSLFGMLYPMCFEYAEMVRFYHSVYRVVYHPQVLLPIRRGLMFQTASASSRVQAKNGIITQGIEIMSLMCKAYESVTTPTEMSSKKPKQFLSQLMSIVRSQPTPAACAAIYQTLRLLHLWSKAREILQLWAALPSFGECEAARSKSYADERAFSDAKMDAEEGVPKISVGVPGSDTTDKADSAVTSSEGDGARAGPRGSEGGGAAAGGRGEPDDDEAVDIYEPIFLYCKADAEAEEMKDILSLMEAESREEGQEGVELRLEKIRLAAGLFEKAGNGAAAIYNGLMEVRALSSCARLEWECLEKVPEARQRLRAIFDKFDTLCSLPNFFTPLRLTGLTAAMRLNSDMGGCYDDSDGEDEDSDEYGFGALDNEDTEDSNGSEEEDEDEDEEEDEEEEKAEEEEEEPEKEGVKAAEVAASVSTINQNKPPASPPSAFAGRSSMKGKVASIQRNRSVRFGESEKEGLSDSQRQDEDKCAEGNVAITQSVDEASTTVESDQTNPGGAEPVQEGMVPQPLEDAMSTASTTITQSVDEASTTVESDQTNPGGEEPVQEGMVSQPLEDAMSTASTTSMVSATSQAGEKHKGETRGYAGRDRRTSGPISVATVIVPIRPSEDKQGSSFGQSGSRANRMILATLQTTEEAGALRTPEETENPGG